MLPYVVHAGNVHIAVLSGRSALYYLPKINNKSLHQGKKEDLAALLAFLDAGRADTTSTSRPNSRRHSFFLPNQTDRQTDGRAVRSAGLAGLLHADAGSGCSASQLKFIPGAVPVVVRPNGPGRFNQTHPIPRRPISRPGLPCPVWSPSLRPDWACASSVLGLS